MEALRSLDVVIFYAVVYRRKLLRMLMDTAPAVFHLQR